MKKVFCFGIACVVFCFACAGCTSVSGNVESALGFSQPVPIKDLIVGSYTYNINDTYIVRSDGSLVLNTEIPYHTEQVFDADGNPFLDQNGQPITQVVMEDYHTASYDELYLWAIRCAADNAKITNIIAIKSFIVTKATNYLIGVSARQDVTVTVYGTQ